MPSDDRLPPAPGAYALLMDLAAPLTLPRPACTLQPGRYVYAGSARGPGGIRARVRRHLRPDKALRWHVDRLTGVAGVAGVVVIPDGRECDLVAALRERDGVEVPCRGFGSSDCRACPAHLLRVPRDLSAAGVARWLGGAALVVAR